MPEPGATLSQFPPIEVVAVACQEMALLPVFVTVTVCATWGFRCPITPVKVSLGVEVVTPIMGVAGLAIISETGSVCVLDEVLKRRKPL